MARVCAHSQLVPWDRGWHYASSPNESSFFSAFFAFFLGGAATADFAFGSAFAAAVSASSPEMSFAAFRFADLPKVTPDDFVDVFDALEVVEAEVSGVLPAADGSGSGGSPLAMQVCQR